METHRLKNIAILILLLLNGCLLLTLGFQKLQTLRTQEQAEDRLRSLSSRPWGPWPSPAGPRQSRSSPPPCLAARRPPPAREGVSTAMKRPTALSSSGPGAAFMAYTWTYRRQTPPVSPGPFVPDSVMKRPGSS